jgi:hypothetical protein
LPAAQNGTIAARLMVLGERIDRDPTLLRRGRQLDAVMQLDIGGDSFLLRLFDGRVVAVTSGPFATPSADFVVAGEAAAWRRFLAADPPPGDHDLFAFLKRKELRLAGNLHPLMSHLLYFKGLFALLREAA